MNSHLLRRLPGMASLLLLLLLLSITVSAQLQPPPAPGNVNVTPGKAKLTVSWGSASGADGYNVYRSVTGASGSFGLFRGELTSTTFDDTFVNNGGTY